MFKRILIPTDGTPLSARAVKAGIKLARQTGAHITGYHAAEPAPTHHYNERFAAARAAGVAFDTVVNTPRSTYEGIIEAAKKSKCDAIVMASHGRRGLQGVLLGSVTNQVLTHSKLPVVVYR